ncbi:MAG: PilZ domain-containing protein [Planctomycetota bacterium]
MPHSSQRADQRFVAKTSDTIKAQLLTLDGDRVESIDCDLNDISTGGCAVRASLDHGRDMTVAVLRVHDEDSGFELEVAGKLCWQQQKSVGSNSFGFRFRRPIDNALIEQMVQVGLVTRRQDDRSTCGAIIGTRRAHGRPPIGEAVLEDYSSTGVRLTVDTVPDVGERLLLTSHSGEGGSVRVVWVSSHAGVNQCGCSFVNLASSRAINDAVDRALA